MSATDTQDGWETVVEPFAPTFQFETEGEGISGIYVGGRPVEQEGLDGKPRTVMVREIEDADGKRWSVWDTHAIAEAFADDKITEGEMIRIIWHGKETIKDGRQTVNKFTVQVKKG